MSTAKSFAMALLNILIDDKEMKMEHKTLLKNLLVPMLEHVEESPSAEEMMNRVSQIIMIGAIASSVAIFLAVKPEGYNRISLKLSERYFKEIELGIQALDEIKKVHMPNAANAK